MTCRFYDTTGFDRRVFRCRDALGVMLGFSRRLMQARLAGLVYGTDASRSHYLPPSQWDRGIIDKFSGTGRAGIGFRLFGRQWARLWGVSPIHLYRLDELGERIPSDGVTAYTLRNHQAFYNRGIRILLIEPPEQKGGKKDFEPWPVVSYDGRRFYPIENIRTNTTIVSRFKAENFITAYIPDYGAIVLSSVKGAVADDGTGRFCFDRRLKRRLDILISAIENASLAYLGTVKGRAAAKMIWRKERGLRRAAAALKDREAALKRQEKQLKAVGAVTPEQLNMAPVSTDGVYAFMDMVGSASISRQLPPREYVALLNHCHEIGADNAARFGCRVDNMIGDGIFFLSVYVFDDWQGYHPGPDERLMLMTLLLASVISDIRKLVTGSHPADRKQHVRHLVTHNSLDIGFRAGMTRGRTLVGPLGSRKRRIVTAVGESVDLAARLEATGLPNTIHMPGNLAAQLSDAWITRDTLYVHKLARTVEPAAQWNHDTGFPFLEFYRAVFNTAENPLSPRGGARCKEFSSPDTWVMSCLPQKDRDTCAGI